MVVGRRSVGGGERCECERPVSEIKCFQETEGVKIEIERASESERASEQEQRERERKKSLFAVVVDLDETALFTLFCRSRRQPFFFFLRFDVIELGERARGCERESEQESESER